MPKVWFGAVPANELVLILRKRGPTTDTVLFRMLTEKFESLGYSDFNRLLMCLEIAGKIRVTRTKSERLVSQV